MEEQSDSESDQDADDIDSSSIFAILNTLFTVYENDWMKKSSNK